MKQSTKLFANRPLRRPFVATVASATMVALGCGGQVAEVERDGTNGTGCPSGAACNPPGPDTPACPEAKPAEGAACGASLQCEYDPDPCGMASLANCTDGSCNPPAPEECPSEAPAAGTPCSPPQGGSCTYEGLCGGDVATCEQNVWKLSPIDADCDCPVDKPVDGTDCFMDQSCRYGDCMGAPNIEAVCTEGSWRVVEPSCNPPEPGQ